MQRYRNTGPKKIGADEYIFVFHPRRRKRIEQATPQWVNKNDLRNIHLKCQQMNEKMCDIQYVVHHIIPISHKKVCGLNVPWNLKIMSERRHKQLGRKFNQND